MFDDEALTIARLFRDKGRSLLAIDAARMLSAPAEIDVLAMQRGDGESWEHWATLVASLRGDTDRQWLPTVLGWFADAPLVLTNLMGREPIRAGASTNLYAEVSGALERLVCTAACGIAPKSIANDDLNASPRRLVARYGRCEACNAPVIPSAGSGAHPDVQFDNDRALDTWRAFPGKAVALVIANHGPLRAQALRLAEASGATVVGPPSNGDVWPWVNKVDHAVVSLGWGGPGRVSIGHVS